MKRAALSLLWTPLALLLAGCGALPLRGDVPPSQAFADTGASTLARIAAASRPADAAAPSGFMLLPTGEYAYVGRLALVEGAERSIDLQYYHLQRDRSGRALLRALAAAAERGVRVRLLLDDLYVSEIDELLVGLVTYGVQVRLFNPLPLRQGPSALRVAFSSGDFEQLNHRMHNKLFIADNTLAVYGGRNIADEYFMNHPDSNFIDLDMLSTGAVVQDLSDVFDRYWNSEAAFPLETVLPRRADAETARINFEASVHGARLPPPGYKLDPLGQRSPADQLAEGRLQLVFADAQVFADPPTKALGAEPLHEPSAAMAGLLKAIGGARREVNIVSPYFVPGEIGMSMMKEAAGHGIRTVLFTNSLASTDVPIVHHRYSDFRLPMLQMGVTIYEFSPALTQRRRSFGNFGRSVPRLHAKVATVDGARLLVGSVNLDARSAVGNTEMGVVIDSPALVQQLAQLFRADRAGSVYRLGLATDRETIEWHYGDEDGTPRVTTEEPNATPWQRFKLWLQSLVVDDRLL